MIRARYLAFDETVGPGETLSSDALCEELGLYDNLAVHLVADDIRVSAGTILVDLYHSGDGVEFIKKATVIPASTSLPLGGVTSVYGYTGGGLYGDGEPTLRFVRFRLWVTSSTAHVKLYVFARDPTG